jgi:hypothetical protein
MARFLYPKPAWLIALSLSAFGQTSIFRIETDEFWLNLHHFLYVLGRAQNNEFDSKRAAVANAPVDAARLKPEHAEAWRNAVTAYANGPSKLDAIFSAALTKKSLSLTGVNTRPDDATLRAVESIYRTTWWPTHREANRQLRARLDDLTAKHGREILAFITKAYGMEWPPRGYTVHLCAYANWAGAYSTADGLLVVGSTTPWDRLNDLEIVFHEAMHQWDDEMNKRLGSNLSHALIFYTAGEAVRRIDPTYTPFAESAGIWDRGMKPFRALLDKHWKPYLEGKGTREEAIRAMKQ